MADPKCSIVSELINRRPEPADGSHSGFHATQGPKNNNCRVAPGLLRSTATGVTLPTAALSADD